MKIQILDTNGNKAKEISTELFSGMIRKDIVQKIIETEKEKAPYAPYLWAGMDRSASGNVLHTRHDWKSDRGKGTARMPKKRMSDKGERFVWVGAIVPGTRGGRRAHPPKLNPRIRVINNKEKKIGFLSALAMISSAELLKSKFSRFEGKDVKIKLPLVVDSKILSLKTSEFLEALKKITGDFYEVSLQKKTIRAGLGSLRNRKYKSNEGALLVIGNKQEKKISGIEVIKVKDLKIIDLASNGPRVVLFTEESVKEMEERIAKQF